MTNHDVNYQCVIHDTQAKDIHQTNAKSRDLDTSSQVKDTLILKMTRITLTKCKHQILKSYPLCLLRIYNHSSRQIVG